jgi:hypothetical protein
MVLLTGFVHRQQDEVRVSDNRKNQKQRDKNSPQKHHVHFA